MEHAASDMHRILIRSAQTINISILIRLHVVRSSMALGPAGYKNDEACAVQDSSRVEFLQVYGEQRLYRVSTAALQTWLNVWFHTTWTTVAHTLLTHTYTICM